MLGFGRFESRDVKAMLQNYAMTHARDGMTRAQSPSATTLKQRYRGSSSGVHENVAAQFCTPLCCTAFDCDGEAAISSSKGSRATHPRAPANERAAEAFTARRPMRQGP